MNDDPSLNGYVLAAIGLLVACSLLTRATYFLFGDHLPLPESVRRALRYAPVAALTGIVVPELLPWDAGAAALLDAKMLAAVAAILVYWRTRSTLLVMLGGMTAYWILAAL